MPKTTQKNMKKIESDITHDRLNQECFQWLWNTHPEYRRTFWHTPNELKRHKSVSVKEHVMEMSRRKSLGTLPGVTDLVWYKEGVLHCFDFKIGYDKLSEDQIKFIKAIEAQGGKFYEINSKQQFIDVVQGDILNLRHKI